MQTEISIEKQVNDLKKRISILEWDLPNIKNSQLKAMKEKSLKNYKQELKGLLQKNLVEIGGG